MELTEGLTAGFGSGESLVGATRGPASAPEQRLGLGVSLETLLLRPVTLHLALFDDICVYLRCVYLHCCCCTSCAGWRGQGC